MLDAGTDLWFRGNRPPRQPAQVGALAGCLAQALQRKQPLAALRDDAPRSRDDRRP